LEAARLGAWTGGEGAGDPAFNLAYRNDRGLISVTISSGEALSGSRGNLVVLDYVVIGTGGVEIPVGLGSVKLNGVFGQNLEWDGEVNNAGGAVLSISGITRAGGSWPLYR
ncbi:hypothetical protein IIC65_07940, partial [Candidatus Sumerlaeota bacterium]|nr:hypothetical protein [Candidatus Sumerlaeota bacterium]